MNIIRIFFDVLYNSYQYYSNLALDIKSLPLKLALTLRQREKEREKKDQLTAQIIEMLLRKRDTTYSPRRYNPPSLDKRHKMPLST